MTVSEAILTLNANAVIACERAGFNSATVRMIEDALDTIEDALKAQEPVEPVKVKRYMETDENGDWYVPETYDCGNCGVELHGKADYCHLCGRAVKWE